jgi:hypothetical protein
VLAESVLNLLPSENRYRGSALRDTLGGDQPRVLLQSRVARCRGCERPVGEARPETLGLAKFGIDLFQRGDGMVALVLAFALYPFYPGVIAARRAEDVHAVLGLALSPVLLGVWAAPDGRKQRLD